MRNAASASTAASSGQGFRLTTVDVDRQVPIRPMKLRLVGAHQTAAPIHGIFSMLSGGMQRVDGEIDFVPQPGRGYYVTGELKPDASTVWVQDAVTHQPATARVTTGR